MMVEVEGIYLSALENMANAYNEQTLQMWNEGERVYLRKKENAESILRHIIFEHLWLKYPDIAKEMEKNILTDINELKGNIEKTKELIKKSEEIVAMSPPF